MPDPDNLLFDDFWKLYPADLCGGARKKGGRGTALKAWEKLSEAEQLEVMEALPRHIRFDRRQQESGADVYRWPFASTWLSQKRYLDDLDADLPDSKPRTQYHCAICSTSQHLIYLGNQHLCSTCYRSRGMPGFAREREIYRVLVEQGMGRVPEETVQEWQERCRQYFIRTFPGVIRG